MPASHVPPYWGRHDSRPDASQSVEVILVERPVEDVLGPWRFTTAMMSVAGQEPEFVVNESWPASVPSLEAWNFLVGIRGGDGSTEMIGGFHVAKPEHVRPVIDHLRVKLENGHPFMPSEPVFDEGTPFDVMPPTFNSLGIWQLTCELVRRHSSRLWPVHTYPLDLQVRLAARVE